MGGKEKEKEEFLPLRVTDIILWRIINVFDYSYILTEGNEKERCRQPGNQYIFFCYLFRRANFFSSSALIT